MRKVSLPDYSNPITKESCEKTWYNFFNDVFVRVLGNTIASLTGTITKQIESLQNTDAVETEVFSYTFKSTKLKNLDVLSIFAGLTRAINANNKTVKFKLNGTAFYTYSATTSGGSFQIKASMINNITSQKIFIDDGLTQEYTTTAIDTNTEDLTLSVTLQGISTGDLTSEYIEFSLNS